MMAATTNRDRRNDQTRFGSSWYALCASDEVNDGRVVGKDFLDGRVVVFRGENGKICVLSAYCRHLGADLSQGKVIGNHLQCAFHHWQYGQDGRCTRIPASDKIPKAARTFSFATAEKWGLVWAFNGKEPLFEVPDFPSIAADEAAYKTEKAFDLPIAPWVLFTNAMDFQHLRELHGLKLDLEVSEIRFSHHRMEYRARFKDPALGTYDQQIRVTGSNTISVGGDLNGMTIGAMITGTPVSAARSTGWIISATPRQSLEQDAIVTRLKIGQIFFKRLLEEDIPIMETIHFREGLLTEGDRLLARFLRFVRRQPKANPLANYR
jgi:nitrite reductase/ring-hydroxylating ferredoxin subunit